MAINALARPQRWEFDVPSVNALMQPLQQGLDRYERGQQQAVENERANKLLSIQQGQFDIAQRRADREDEDAKVARIGREAAAIHQVQGPQRQQLWQQWAQRNPDVTAHMTRFGVDPRDYVKGPEFLAVQAGQWDPQAVKRAQSAMDLQAAQAEQAKAHGAYYRGRADVDRRERWKRAGDNMIFDSFSGETKGVAPATGNPLDGVGLDADNNLVLPRAGAGPQPAGPPAEFVLPKPLPEAAAPGVVIAPPGGGQARPGRMNLGGPQPYDEDQFMPAPWDRPNGDAAPHPGGAGRFASPVPLGQRGRMNLGGPDDIDRSMRLDEGRGPSQNIRIAQGPPNGFSAPLQPQIDQRVQKMIDDDAEIAKTMGPAGRDKARNQLYWRLDERGFPKKTSVDELRQTLFPPPPPPPPSPLELVREQAFGIRGQAPSDVYGLIVNPRSRGTDVPATRAAAGQAAIERATPEQQARLIDMKTTQEKWSAIYGPARSGYYYLPNGKEVPKSERSYKGDSEQQAVIGFAKDILKEAYESLGQQTFGYPGRAVSGSLGYGENARAFSDYQLGAMSAAFTISGKNVSNFEHKIFDRIFVPQPLDSWPAIDHKHRRLTSFLSALEKGRSQHLSPDENWNAALKQALTTPANNNAVPSSGSAGAPSPRPKAAPAPAPGQYRYDPATGSMRPAQ